MFGLPFSNPTRQYWGARAIFKNWQIDLVPDRQSYTEIDSPFAYWLDNTALPWLRKECKNLSYNENRTISLSNFKYEIQANPNSSCGYLYIGACEHVVENVDKHWNNSSGKWEDVVRLENRKIVVDNPLPCVGKTGEIFVNNIGPATVVGYKEIPYVSEMNLVCLLVDVMSPPKWLVEQNFEDYVRKNAKVPVKPRVRKELIKNWEFPPISIFRSSFVEDE